MKPRHLFLFFLLPFLCAAALPAVAAPVVASYSFKVTGDKTAFHLQTPEVLDAKVYTLANPPRVVIDIPQGQWKVPPAARGRDKVGAIQRVRNGWPEKGMLRVVLDLVEGATLEDTYTSLPSRLNEPHALVVVVKNPKDAPAQAFAKPEAKTRQAWKEKATVHPQPEKKPFAVMADSEAKAPAKSSAKSPVVEDIGFIPVPHPKPEIYTIVIDAGHGGVDPGARGRSGIWEKEITARFAADLKRVLEEAGRYRVVLTRPTDHYVPLKDRVRKAVAAEGHLFISLHADSHPDPALQGLSVYTLSEQASDKEAEALATAENHSDMIAGVDLSRNNPEVAEVLIDLARRDTKNISARFAELVVSEIGTEAKLLRNTHRFAGFAVLKGIGIPSVLVELGYLSNPKEEELLRTDSYRERLVSAIARAVDTYCDQYVLRPDEE